MPEVSGVPEALLQVQNPDGGWSFQRGASWTEPTAFALLALAALDCAQSEAWRRGVRWLTGMQRADGGWSPNPQVQLSTAVTGTALLALGSALHSSLRDRGLRWLAAQAKPELTLVERLAYWWQDRPANETVMGGMPWFPGTAAWVAPTVMATLCFQKAQIAAPSPAFPTLIRQAKAYLLSRRCQGGGWNHGGSALHSEDAAAYPEMTGMALLAFAKQDAALIASDLALGESMLHAPLSSEGQSWLRMALTWHGRQPNVSPRQMLTPRNTRDLCLRLLADHAGSPNQGLLTAHL